MVKALLKSLRPHQWFKNLFVVAPLAFSKHLLDVEYVGWSALAFGIFSLLSGSVYLVNDIFDIEKDRAHPVKRRRPIASGELPLPVARTAAALLIVVSLGASLSIPLAPPRRGVLRDPPGMYIFIYFYIVFYIFLYSF